MEGGMAGSVLASAEELPNWYSLISGSEAADLPSTSSFPGTIPVGRRSPQPVQNDLLAKIFPRVGWTVSPPVVRRQAFRLNSSFEPGYNDGQEEPTNRSLS
jgi:hypothetical protein